MSDTDVEHTMYEGTRWTYLGGNMYPTNEPEELSNISSGQKIGRASCRERV